MFVFVTIIREGGIFWCWRLEWESGREEIKEWMGGGLLVAKCVF